MNEDRILDKLDVIQVQNTEALVEITKIQEQIRDVPDLRNRVTALEKWRWTALGALGAASTSLGAQMLSALKGGGA